MSNISHQNIGKSVQIKLAAAATSETPTLSNGFKILLSIVTIFQKEYSRDVMPDRRCAHEERA